MTMTTPDARPDLDGLRARQSETAERLRCEEARRRRLGRLLTQAEGRVVRAQTDKAFADALAAIRAARTD